MTPADWLLLGGTPRPAEIDLRLAALAHTHQANGQRLVERFGSAIRDTLEPFGWKRGRWPLVVPFADQAQAAMYVEALAILEAGPEPGQSATSHEARIAGHLDWARISGMQNRRMRMVREAIQILLVRES
jgi:hypothetical protein